MLRPLLRLLVCAHALLLTSLKTEAAEPWPDGKWPHTTPAAVGLTEAPPAALDADFASGRIPLIDSFLVVRCGAIATPRRRSQRRQNGTDLIDDIR